jgi:hypothetical protein
MAYRSPVTMTRANKRTPAVLLSLALLLPFAADRGAFERAWATWLMQLLCDCPAAEAPQAPARGCCQDEAPPQGPKATAEDGCCCLAQPMPEESERTPLVRSASSATGDCQRWVKSGADVSARAPAVIAHGVLGEHAPPGWLDPPGPRAPEGAAASSPFAVRRLTASGAERAAPGARL